jgi:hypothetical protein
MPWNPDTRPDTSPVFPSKVICECRCDETLKTKVEGSTLLTYTEFHGGLEHLKIETRLIDERFTRV